MWPIETSYLVILFTWCCHEKPVKYLTVKSEIMPNSWKTPVHFFQTSCISRTTSCLNSWAALWSAETRLFDDSSPSQCSGLSVDLMHVWWRTQFWHPHVHYVGLPLQNNEYIFLHRVWVTTSIKRHCQMCGWPGEPKAKTDSSITTLDLSPIASMSGQSHRSLAQPHEGRFQMTPIKLIYEKMWPCQVRFTFLCEFFPLGVTQFPEDLITQTSNHI